MTRAESPGIKRHCSGLPGLPHAIAVTTAEVTDRMPYRPSARKPSLSLLCDSGYVGRPFAQGVQDILGGHVAVQIAKRSELHTFKVMPQRWVVERSFAWIGEEQAVVEELREVAEHQLAVRPFGILGSAAQKIFEQALRNWRNHEQSPSLLTTSRGTFRVAIDGSPDAPALVLSNSLGTTLEMWDAQVAALSASHRLIRYDTRGHGGSPVTQAPTAWTTWARMCWRCWMR